MPNQLGAQWVGTIYLANHVCNTRRVDELRERLAAATQARHDADAQVETVRAELYDAIAEALAAGIRQTEVVHITGYTRERIRQIMKDRETKPPRP